MPKKRRYLDDNPPRGTNGRANTVGAKLNNVLHHKAYVYDRLIDAANKAGVIPAHVALPLRDLNTRITNSPSRSARFVYNLLNGQDVSDAWQDSDINPNQYLTFVPQGMDDRNFTDEELAELHLRSQLSKGKPGQITAYGNRQRNEQIDGDQHYAANISSRGFNSPDNVAEWAVGQSSGIQENGYPYLYDRYAFDIDDTYGVYKDPRAWIASPMKAVRFVMGNLGSKGYPGNTQTSYASIPIQISEKAMKDASKRVKKKQEQRVKDSYIYRDAPDYEPPYKSLKRIGAYKDGGRIYIKPENRGKFTALKKRTGHSASWFKENGTPAQKKMAVFALNARKWKH